MTSSEAAYPVSSDHWTGRFVWWLHPSFLVFFVLIPTYLFLWMIGVATGGRISSGRGLFFFKNEIAVLGFFGMLVLGIGTLSPIQHLNRRTVEERKFVAPYVLTVLGGLTMLGYAYWFKDFILKPGVMLQILKNSTSATYALRSSIDKSAGISSLAQLGLPFLALYGHARWAGGHSLLVRTHHVLVFAILLATTVRVFAWGERVALIEVAVAMGFVWVSRAKIRNNFLKNALPWLPFFGLAGVVSLFAIGEYFRSWSAHYSSTNTSFWTFILQRLANYYFNALNTGAGRLITYDWPTYAFEWTLRWVHKIPFIGSLFSFLVDFRPNAFLERYGDPEFNNPSGLFSIFYDVGIVGGLFTMLMIGALSKFFYIAWRRNSSIIGIFYFPFLMTFMEIFRYYYLGDSRCFMVILGIGAAVLFNVPAGEKK